MHCAEERLKRRCLDCNEHMFSRHRLSIYPKVLANVKLDNAPPTQCPPSPSLVLILVLA